VEKWSNARLNEPWLRLVLIGGQDPVLWRWPFPAGFLRSVTLSLKRTNGDFHPVTQIIFEDDHIQVYHQPGSRPFHVVTFSEMGATPDGGAWAAIPLNKLGIGYFGFVSKRPNWFPSQSVEAAISQFASHIDADKPIITYGFSQGGYAALRYAGNLNARTAIAVAPQYSIKPDDMNGKDKRFHEYYSLDDCHRSIGQEDVPNWCKSIIIYDPWEWHDDLNAEYINRSLKIDVFAKMYGTGHQVIRCMASSILLNELMELAASGDVVSIKKLVIDAKRKWKWRGIYLNRPMADKCPVRAESSPYLIESLQNTDVSENVVANFYYKSRFDVIVKFRSYISRKLVVDDLIFKSLIIMNLYDDARLWVEARMNEDQKIKYLVGLNSHSGNNKIPVTSINDLSDVMGDNKSYYAWDMGWHCSETWGRWSSGLIAKIDLYCDMNNIGIIKGEFLKSSEDQNLSIFFNEIYGCDDIEIDGNFFLVKFQGEKVLNFKVDKLVCPATYMETTDLRFIGVGVALHSFETIEASSLKI